MVGFTSNIPTLIDSLILLEQIPKVETGMNQTMKDDIANTMSNVRAWFNAFAEWMATSGVG